MGLTLLNASLAFKRIVPVKSVSLRRWKNVFRRMVKIRLVVG